MTTFVRWSNFDHFCLVVKRPLSYPRRPPALRALRSMGAKVVVIMMMIIKTHALPRAPYHYHYHYHYYYYYYYYYFYYYYHIRRVPSGESASLRLGGPPRQLRQPVPLHLRLRLQPLHPPPAAQQVVKRHTGQRAMLVTGKVKYGERSYMAKGRIWRRFKYGEWSNMAKGQIWRRVKYGEGSNMAKGQMRTPPFRRASAAPPARVCKCVCARARVACVCV